MRECLEGLEHTTLDGHPSTGTSRRCAWSPAHARRVAARRLWPVARGRNSQRPDGTTLADLLCAMLVHRRSRIITSPPPKSPPSYCIFPTSVGSWPKWTHYGAHRCLGAVPAKLAPILQHRKRNDALTPGGRALGPLRLAEDTWRECGHDKRVRQIFAQRARQLAHSNTCQHRWLRPESASRPLLQRKTAWARRLTLSGPHRRCPSLATMHAQPVA